LVIRVGSAEFRLEQPFLAPDEEDDGQASPKTPDTYRQERAVSFFSTTSSIKGEAEMSVKLKDLFLEELKREEAGTRKALERVPEGQNDWAPHEKSMKMGYLASLVASMPAWIDMMIKLDELDFAPVGENKNKPIEWTKTSELVAIFDESMKKGIAALEGTTDEHLMTTWKLKAAGHLISEDPRYVNILNGMLMHWAHHRGQLTVYLRLNEAPVPALYGPSADEKFGF
jgi:uncharacterized damage-inducible protein DinB